MMDAQLPMVPLSVPCLRGREEEYVLDCLRSGWISSIGAYVTRFEEQTAAYAGVAHAVAVMNGTSALHLALLTCGVAPGDLVIVPSVTFIAPANAIRYVGADPVFLDIDPLTLGLSPDAVAEFIAGDCEERKGVLVHQQTGRRVAAIVPVHLYGHACDIEKLTEIGEEHGIPVVEDAAEGVGCRVGGRHVGAFGRVGCLSFNGNKLLTTGGGGMLLTDDLAIADRARHLSTQAKADPFFYSHDDVGYNYRMTNVQAAIGLGQLEELDAMIARKRDVYGRYHAAFAGLPDVSLFCGARWCDCTYWMALLRFEPSRHEQFVQHMSRRRIQVRPIWGLCHEQVMYRDCPRGELAESESLAAEGMCLPCSQSMSHGDVGRVICAVTDFFG